MFYRAVIKMRNVAAFCEKEHAVSSMDPCTVIEGGKRSFVIEIRLQPVCQPLNEDNMPGKRMRGRG